MRPSNEILHYIKQIEVLKLKAYMPTPNDVPTIGYGSTGPDIKLGMVWTKEQAEARFKAFCDNLAAQMSRALGNLPTTQKQFDAMFSLAYNVGIGGFLRSSVLKNHKSGRFISAKTSFGLWVKQAGKTLRGLVIRRAKEADIYDD